MTNTRIEHHKIKGAKVPCHEIYCVYELDEDELWHSQHNNKIRILREKAGVCKLTELVHAPTLRGSEANKRNLAKPCPASVFLDLASFGSPQPEQENGANPVFLRPRAEQEKRTCCCLMLCASVLADLKANVPVEMRIAPPRGDAASMGSEASDMSIDSSQQDARSTTVSTASVSSADANALVGAPRDFLGLSPGTVSAYKSIDKWILVALKKLGKQKNDILLPSFEPNDELCSQTHNTIADWHTSRTTARDAGVVDHRPSELEKPPPQDGLIKQSARESSLVH